MAFDPLTAGLELGGKLIDRLLPDKAANDAAKAQLVSAEVQGDIQSVFGQLEVDKTEAASQSTFVAGWRPFVGWVCGAAMAYGFIGQPFIVTIIYVVQCVAGHKTFDKAMLPIIDMSQMWPVLLGMLGMGVLRSFDKTIPGTSASGQANGH